MGYGGRGGWRRGVAAAAGAALCLSAGWAQAADRYVTPAAKALALNPTLVVSNVVDVQSSRFDSDNNALVVAWQYDTAYLPGDACYGYVFGLDSAAVWAATPDTAAAGGWRNCNFPGGDSVRIELGESIRFSARYYVSVRLQIRQTVDWGPPSPASDSAFGGITTPSYTWEPIRYFLPSPNDTVWAFNEHVAVWPADRWEMGSDWYDTVDAFRLGSPPSGFIPVSTGFTFRVTGVSVEWGSLQFWMGLTYDSIPSGHDPSEIRVYRRTSGGQYHVFHDCLRVPGHNMVAARTRFTGADPLILMIDTQEPVCSLLTSVADPVARSVAVEDSIRVTDNCANVIATFSRSRGEEAPVAAVAETLDGAGAVYRTVIEGTSVQAAAGARAYVVVSDGPHSRTINLSRQVLRSPASDVQIMDTCWAPLRTTAALDSPAFVGSMVRSITGGGYDTKKVRVFRWFDGNATADSSDTTHTWVEYDPSKTGVFALTPGKLMWIKSRSSARLNFGNGRTVSLRDTVSVVLPPDNWTDFALPYGGTFREYLGDILLATGRPTADSLQFYRWVRSGKVYSAQLIHAPKLAVDTFINPLFQLTSEVADGYSVYNPFDTAVTLRIPPICAPMSSAPGLFRALPKAAMPPGSWALTLRPELAEGVVLGPIVLGYRPGAGAAMTPYPLAPTFASAGVRLYDRQTGYRYGHQVWHRPSGDGVAYELEFYNDGDAARQVRFHVDGVAALGEGAFVTLGDPQTGAVQPVAGTLAVDVPAKSSVYRMLTVGGAGYHTVLYANVQPLAQFRVYSSPCRSGLTVQFMLPTDVSRVECRLVDAAGRLVWRRTQRAGLRAGMNRLDWNGSAAAGMYVLDVAVFDRSGRRTAARQQPVMRLP